MKQRRLWSIKIKMSTNVQKCKPRAILMRGIGGMSQILLNIYYVLENLLN